MAASAGLAGCFGIVATELRLGHAVDCLDLLLLAQLDAVLGDLGSPPAGGRAGRRVEAFRQRGTAGAVDVHPEATGYLVSGFAGFNHGATLPPCPSFDGGFT